MDDEKWLKWKWDDLKGCIEEYLPDDDADTKTAGEGEEDSDDYDMKTYIDRMLASIPKARDLEVRGSTSRAEGIDSIIDSTAHTIHRLRGDSVIGSFDDYLGAGSLDSASIAAAASAGKFSSGIILDSGRIMPSCLNINKDVSVEISIEDSEGKHIHFSSEDIKAMQKMAEKWGIVKEEEPVVNQDVFARIPGTIIQRTVEAIKSAIDTADCGKSPTPEVVAMKTAILEIVEKFVK